MEDYAARTGLDPTGEQVRYLWTDAFAVCNYLTLFRRTGMDRYGDRAVRLIDAVHHVLGRHRDDDTRSGWISGLSDEEGERHPTAGGLRIGKRLGERGQGDPYDSRLEWDRDGQYYHYLVRWIHALVRAGRVLGNESYHVWAVELAEAAHRAFVYSPKGGGPKRMVWKMSIDLSRPLVPSEGAHDPLDGLVAASALRGNLLDGVGPQPALDRLIDELSDMCVGRGWITEDPLGAGGLLMDASWLTRLLDTDERTESLRPMVTGLWEDSLLSLAAVARGYPLDRGTADRLAFRELGLAIGLFGVDALGDETEALPSGAEQTAEAVARHVPLGDTIVEMWMAPEARAAESWKAHENINSVMLATALAPDEYLAL
jgi:hypothetical protein